MNVFEAVKQSVTTRQAAEHYGIRVNRNGMACCPFHNDKTPSMKLDKRFHCFGCGADGDVIDFVAALYGLGKKEAAAQLASDFGLAYEDWKPPGRARKPKPRQKSPEEQFREAKAHCFRVLADYLHLLRVWKTDYAPHSPEEAFHPRFVEALQKQAHVEYLLDVLLFGETEEKAVLIMDYGKDVIQLEQRMAELAAADAARTKKHHERHVVTVTDEETGALTPEGNLTLVDDYHTDYSDGSGQQFITLVSKSGATFYLVIDRNAKGQQTVHFMNLVDEADLLALMEEDAADAYTAEKEAAAQAELDRLKAEEEAKKAAEEAAASGEEQPKENKVTKIASGFLGVVVLIALAAGGGFYVFAKQKQKKQAEKEALDPDANYTEDKGDFEIPVEDEPEETDEEDTEPI